MTRYATVAVADLAAVLAVADRVADPDAPGGAAPYAAVRRRLKAALAAALEGRTPPIDVPDFPPEDAAEPPAPPAGGDA